MCGCGSRLDLEKQKNEPYAYEFGHRPAKEKEKKLKRARPSRKKVILENLAKVGQPLLVMKEKEIIMPITPLPASIEYPETKEQPFTEYRPLFEKMIHHLPWDEFQELLQLLLEIQTRRDRSA
jgi:hypothetical protein